jgi:cation diffusion facilitator CzcD-associated flavoprotein CzcO
MLQRLKETDRPVTSADLDVAIVGAGPYGLSLAAHLRSAGISFRIFGKPMQAWLEQMPKGMHLKSDGFSSNLCDPGSKFTWKRYCEKHGIAYGDHGVPIGLEDFAAYGLEFQQLMVPDLEKNMIDHVSQTSGGFKLQLDTGEVVTARRVVIAVGVKYFEYVPPALSNLPAEFLSHSGQHYDLSIFKGRRVAVVGGGASAIDVAALLKESGALPQLIARKDKLEFHSPPGPVPSRWAQLFAPKSGLGWGWQSRFYYDGAAIFYYLPLALRKRSVRRAYGPSGGYFIRDKVVGKMPIILGHTVDAAKAVNGELHLELRGPDGSQQVVVDHVIAGTGYKIDLRRLPFLDTQLKSSLKHDDFVPVLTPKSESSIPGLYFVGPVAANSFGPVMRFTCGARFTAPLVARAISRTLATAG